MKGYDHMQLATRLSHLQKGSGYNPELNASRFDQKLLTKKADKIEGDVEVSKRVLGSLPFSSRMARDIRIDYDNPREELPKYTKTEDQIPPFDKSALTMISGSDGFSKQQLQMVISGRENYVKEETKFDRTLEDYENTLGTHTPPTVQDHRKEYQEQMATKLAEAMETSQL